MGPAEDKGQLLRAARLSGAAYSILKNAGATIQAADEKEYEADLASLRERLDSVKFNAAREEGLKMTVDEAVAYALGEERGLKLAEMSGGLPRQTLP